MANPLVDTGTGAALVFTTTSWTAEIVEMNLSGLTRESIDVSHLASTGGRVFIPGDLYDPGELEVKFHYNNDSRPPFTGAKEIVQIKYPLAGTITTASNTKIDMFVTEVGNTIPLEDKMEGTVKLKMSGTFTFSAAA